MCNSSYDPAKCQTVSEMLARLGDKWTVLVIMMLADGPQRLSERIAALREAGARAGVRLFVNAR